jgi:importin subunit alpha-1
MHLALKTTFSIEPRANLSSSSNSLLNVQQPDNDSLLGNVTWTLSNLCRGKPQPALAMVQAAIPALCYLVCNSKVDDITTDALWALSYISDGDDDRINAILLADSGITKSLVKHIDSGKAQVIAPALRILGNFVSGNEEQTQAVLDANVLGVAMKTLGCSKKNLRKEMCWLLSNISAGTQKQITTLLSSRNLADKLVTLAVEAEWETRKEAIWAVSNIFTGGSDSSVALLVNQKGIDAMVSVLDLPGENRMLLVALDAIHNMLTVSERQGYRYGVIFDECGGIEKLEDLQSHNDQQVYDKVVDIIERFFGEEEAEDENLAPTFNGNSFAFGMSSPPPAKILFDSPEITPSSFGAMNNFNFGT